MVAKLRGSGLWGLRVRISRYSEAGFYRKRMFYKHRMRCLDRSNSFPSRLSKVGCHCSLFYLFGVDSVEIYIYRASSQSLTQPWLSIWNQSVDHLKHQLSRIWRGHNTRIPFALTALQDAGSEDPLKFQDQFVEHHICVWTVLTAALTAC